MNWTEKYPGRHEASFSTPSASYTAGLQQVHPVDAANKTFDSTLRRTINSPQFNYDFFDNNAPTRNAGQGVTGAGHAAETFRHVSRLTKEALGKRPGALYFTASEPSRQRLYDNLVGKVGLIHPDYVGYRLHTGGSDGRYAIVHKESENALHAAAKLHGVRAEKLNTVKPTSRARLARSAPLTVPIESIIPDKDNLDTALHSLRNGRPSRDTRPLEVYRSGEKYILADGHHRLLQAILNGKTHVEVSPRDSIKPPSAEGGVELNPNEKHYGLRLQRVRLAAIPPPGSNNSVLVRVPTPTPVGKPPALKPSPTFILPG